MNNTSSKNIALEASFLDDVLYFSTYDFPRFVRVIAFQDESDFMGEWDKSQSREAFCDAFVFQPNASVCFCVRVDLAESSSLLLPAHM